MTNKYTPYHVAIVAQELKNIREILYCFSKWHFRKELSSEESNEAIEEMDDRIVPTYFQEKEEI